MSEAPFPVEPAHVRRPRLGYAMAAAAALLWGINGAVSKTILSTGLSSERLAQVRSLGAAVGLFAVVAVLAPRRLRLTRRELPYLLVFGVVGLAFVQWFYFLAIHRLAIGVALLIEYLAPLLVALWARFAYHDPVRRRIWAALGLALAGLALIVNLFGGGASLSTAGVLFALGGAFAYALYVLLAEHVVGGRDPVSLLAWGFFFTSVFWAVLVPWWRFPPHALTDSTSLHGHLHAVYAPGLGARGLDDRARHDRAVLPARQRPAAPIGDAGRDRRHARAGRGRARRLDLARRGARRRAARRRRRRPGGDRAGADGPITPFAGESSADPPFGGGFEAIAL